MKRTRHIPPIAPEIFARIRKILAEYNVMPALRALTSQGADEMTVLKHLDMLGVSRAGMAEASRILLLGISLRQARSFVVEINHVSAMMERITGDFWVPKTPPASYIEALAKKAIADSLPHWRQEWADNCADYVRRTPRDFHEQLLLPFLLRDYASALESYLRVLESLRKHPLRTSALCQLTRHVKSTTGDWHDSEIAELVNAAEERVESKTYTSKAHANWRKRNEILINSIGTLSVYPALLPSR